MKVASVDRFEPEDAIRNAHSSACKAVLYGIEYKRVKPVYGFTHYAS